MIGFFSKKLGETWALSVFLDQPVGRVGVLSPPPEAVVGWGRKRPGLKARHYAKQKTIPFICLEDGFIRSYGLSASGEPALSLAVDYTGIYYDATHPSDLETLIREKSNDKASLSRAHEAIQMIKRYRLSKYNCAPNLPIEVKKPAVLVVDQTVGDASVIFGQCTQETFQKMLDEAIRDNPDHDILVKVHPDCLSGKKKSYLLSLAKERGCRIIDYECNPWSLFDCVGKVYVATSQLGFEALMAGKEVHCYGLPFYAGWGLTLDRQTCERRSVQRGLEQVFYAAYIAYCRYVDPVTNERCELERVIEHLAFQVQQRQAFRSENHSLGLSYWKKPIVRSFLGVDHLASSRGLSASLLASDKRLVVWGSRFYQPLAGRSRVLRVEDGFLRSSGLGAALIRPLSLAIDDLGLYYDASRPSRLETILNEVNLNQAESLRTKSLKQRIIDLGLTKYNVHSGAWQRPQTGRKVVLVVGQVERDASIAYGSPQIKTNHDLLKAVREHCPDDFILYKPHPDIVAKLRSNSEDCDDKGSSHLYDERIDQASVDKLLTSVDELHTMTSLMGFEALMRGVPVFCYGLPFYAGWGLTTDRLTCSRRLRKLSVDELVYGALIAYPRYYSTKSDMFLTPEQAVEELASLVKECRRPETWFRRGVRYLLSLRARMRQD